MTQLFDAKTIIPPAVEWDGDWYESEKVLAYNGEYFVAHFQRIIEYNGQDMSHEDAWVQTGRDGYKLRGVTHWAHLPPKP